MSNLPAGSKSLDRKELSAALCFVVFTCLAWQKEFFSIAPILGWLSALSLVAAAYTNNRPRYKSFFLAGIALNLSAFWWMKDTIIRFTDASAVLAYGLFALFIIAGSIQFLAFAFFYRNLESLAGFGVRIPVAWCAASILPVRVFPWEVGHSQLNFTHFIQIADIAGVTLISFLMLWCAESLWILLCIRRPEKLIPLAVPLVLFGVSILYGDNRIRQFSTGAGQIQKIALVQANEGIHAKHRDPKASRYSEMTEAVSDLDTLVIWPESVIKECVNDNVKMATRSLWLPVLSKPLNLLAGGKSFSSPEKVYNSAIAIFKDYSVPVPYHKQRLMPLGEYLPLGEWIPWIKRLRSGPNMRNLAAGDKAVIFSFPRADGGVAKVSPLICYEDLIPDLSRQATLSGAHILVNMTNDVWFGDSSASFNHYIIGSFRAVENRRYLLRSTNSGITAVVDPSGRTQKELPPFTEGILEADVILMEGFSLYTLYAGNLFSWILLAASLVLVLTVPLQKRKR